MKRLGSSHVQYCIKELNIQPEVGRIMQHTRLSLQLLVNVLNSFSGWSLEYFVHQTYIEQKYS